MSALGSKPAPGVQPPAQSSMPQNTAVSGSSCRPGVVKVPIETSAPTEPHTLGRAPAGWLK